jgi:hypothetical protein
VGMSGGEESVGHSQSVAEEHAVALLWSTRPWKSSKPRMRLPAFSRVTSEGTLASAGWINQRRANAELLSNVTLG